MAAELPGSCCDVTPLLLPLELQVGHLLLVDGVLVVEPLVLVHGVRSGAVEPSAGSIAWRTKAPES